MYVEITRRIQELLVNRDIFVVVVVIVGIVLLTSTYILHDLSDII